MVYARQGMSFLGMEEDFDGFFGKSYFAQTTVIMCTTDIKTQLKHSKEDVFIFGILVACLGVANMLSFPNNKLVDAIEYESESDDDEEDENPRKKEKKVKKEKKEKKPKKQSYSSDDEEEEEKPRVLTAKERNAAKREMKMDKDYFGGGQAPAKVNRCFDSLGAVDACLNIGFHAEKRCVVLNDAET